MKRTVMDRVPVVASGTAVQPTQARQTHPLRYAVGMFGTSIPINMFNAYLAYFYVERHGLDGRIYATIMIIYTVIDALDNVAYGYLSDRTRSRWGRRRPWMMVAAPLLAICLVAFFAVPDSLTGVSLVVWFAIFAIGTETFDSMLNASYGPVLPESFRTEKRRATANSLRQGFQLVAMALSIAMTPKLTQWFGFSQVAVAFAVIALVVIMIMATGVREDPAVQSQPQPRLLDTIKGILTTRQFWPIALAGGAYSAGMGLTVAAVPFFVTYALGRNQGDGTYLLVAVLATAVLALPAWTALVRRHGALVGWRTALITLTAGLLVLTMITGLGSGIGVCVVIGLGYAGVLATVDLIVARLLDADTAAHGIRRESMFLAGFGLLNQLSGFAQSLGFLLVAVLFGYHSGTVPGPHPERAARFLQSVLPACFLVVAVVCSWFVRLPAPPDTESSSVEEAHADEPHAPGQS